MAKKNNIIVSQHFFDGVTLSAECNGPFGYHGIEKQRYIGYPLEDATKRFKALLKEKKLTIIE